MNIQLRKEVLQNAFLDPRHRFELKTQTLEVRYDPLTGRTARIAHLGAIAPLPLNPDGSAPEHPASAAGAISDPSLWRFNNNQPPAIDYNYRNLKIKVDTRGHARKFGTLTFADLDPLPRASGTYLLQCGAPNPRGVVKWTGVRFSDFAEMLGMQHFAHYARFIGADRFWTEESMETLLRPQVMLAWMMNDQPIAPKHGAPLRLIIPFRYGARHVKAISEMVFSPTGFPLPQMPA